MPAHYSPSQWRNWCTCPAKTYAEYTGAWKRTATAPMLMGGWVDVKLLTPHLVKTWMDDNKLDLLEAGLVGKSNGNPLAKAKKVAEMVARAKADRTFFAHLRNDTERQVELRAKLYGFEWLCHIDVLTKDKMRVTDLKTTASLTDEKWVDRYDMLDRHVEGLPRRGSGRGNFIEANNYWMQVPVVYHDAVQYNFDTDPVCNIAAVSQQNPCDLAIIAMDNKERVSFERERIIRSIEKVQSWKEGKLEDAPRCGQCDYCRATKVELVETYSGPDVFGWM